MNATITFLTMMVLLFAGLGQTHSLNPSLAFAIAGVLAAITMVLAIVRYRARKSGTG